MIVTLVRKPVLFEAGSHMLKKITSTVIGRQEYYKFKSQAEMQHTKGTRHYVKECRLSIAVHHIQCNISKKQPWKTATKRQDETSSDSVKHEEVHRSNCYLRNQSIKECRKAKNQQIIRQTF